MKRLFPILLSLWTLVAFGADPTINGANIRAATLPITAIAPQPANTTLCNATGGSAVPTACDAATMRTNIGAGTGTGDASTNTATSVDGEITLFSSTTGKLLKRATGSGLAKVTSGVFSTATAGTDYYNPGGTDVALADGGTGASLTDPNADRILFWDDSAGAVTWLTAGTGLTITGTTIDASGVGLTNFTEAANSSSPNATVPVASLTATNAATDVDVALVAKGAGATVAQVPDSTTAGGNKRGARSFDFQKSRAAATQVASGSNGFIGSGANNTVGSSNSFVGAGLTNSVTVTSSGIVAGTSNSISGGQYAFIGAGNGNQATQNQASVVGGSSNTASGSNSFIGGGNGNAASGSAASIPGGSSNTVGGTNAFAVGNFNTANGTGSIAIGQRATDRSIEGTFAFAEGMFAAAGDAQRREFMLRRSTTDATPVVLTTDGTAPGTDDQIILPNNSLFSLRGQCDVRENATGDSKAIEFKGAIKRGANAAATALLGSVTQADLGTADAGATWTFAFTADTTNGGLKIEFTGEASHTLRTACNVVTTEVTG